MILPEPIDFRSRFRRARILCGYSQASLAKALDVHKFTISKWERGDCEPRSVRLVQIVDTLKTTIPWLANGEGKGPR